MTSSEATEVFSIVATVYGIHPERVDAQAPVWVAALEPLDVGDAMEIVQAYLAGRGPERLPTVVAFVQAVKSLRGAPEQPQKLQDTPVQPLWVVMWHLARDERLDVVFPEQEGGYRQQGYDWPPDGRRLLDDPSDSVYLDLEARARAKPQEPLRQGWEPTFHCQVCRDDGFVDVGRHIFFQGGQRRLGEIQSAPCPECYRGKHIQFPENGRCPWGEEGFWRGQSWRIVRAGVVEITA